MIERFSAEATTHRDLGYVANVYSLRLATSSHALDRQASEVALEVARAHWAAWAALTGHTRGDA